MYQFRIKLKGIHSNEFLRRMGHNPAFEETSEMIQVRPGSLIPINANDFRNFTPPGSESFDSLVQNLSDMRVLERGSRSRSTMSGSRTDIDPEAKRVLDEHQSLQKYDPTSPSPLQACHLIPKTEDDGKLTIKQNPDNFLASYEFHNGLDGLHTTPMILPRFMVKFVRKTNASIFATDGMGRKVCIKLAFRDGNEVSYWMTQQMDSKWSFKPDCKMDDRGTIEGFVHARPGCKKF